MACFGKGDEILMKHISFSSSLVEKQNLNRKLESGQCEHGCYGNMGGGSSLEELATVCPKCKEQHVCAAWVANASL